MSEVLVTRGQFLVCNTRVIVNLLGDDIRVIERNADVLNACKDIGLAVNIGKTKYMEIGSHRGVIANSHIKIGSNSYEKVETLDRKSVV